MVDILGMLEGEQAQSGDLIVMAGRDVSIHPKHSTLNQRQLLIPANFLTMLALNLVDRKTPFGDNQVLFVLKVVDLMLGSQYDSCRFAALLVAMAAVKRGCLTKLAMRVLTSLLMKRHPYPRVVAER